MTSHPRRTPVLSILFLVLAAAATRAQDLAHFLLGSLTGGVQELRTWDLDDGTVARVGTLPERFEVITFDREDRLIGVTRSLRLVALAMSRRGQIRRH